MVSSAVLPPLNKVTDYDQPFYQIVMPDGTPYVFAIGMSEAMPCEQYMEDHASAPVGSVGDLTLGVAAKAKALPGMGSLTTLLISLLPILNPWPQYIGSLIYIYIYTYLYSNI